MRTDNRAKAIWHSGNYTCVLCKEAAVYTSTERGVKPLVGWLEAGLNLRGCVAADKVVGKATAYLYVLLGARAVYADVLSRGALEVLQLHGIEAEYRCLTDAILNRRGDGFCPFETAVLHAQSPAEAYAIIRRTMQSLR